MRANGVIATPNMLSLVSSIRPVISHLLLVTVHCLPILRINIVNLLCILKASNLNNHKMPHFRSHPPVNPITK